MDMRQRIGITADRAYVVLDARIEHREGTFTSVDHEPLTGYDQLTISGAEVAYRRRSPYAAGQIVDSLDRITKPAAGWSVEEIREVREIWDRWHLNGMRAACAHMDLATLIREPDGYGGKRIVTGHLNRCRESGYTYGSAWLVEPLPDDVRERVVHLFRDRSDDLYRERGYDAGGKRYPKE